MTTTRELIRPAVGHAEVPRSQSRANALDLLEPDFDDLDSDQHGEWVDAAPFRAHVRQLIEEHGLTWRTIAVLADVPAPALAGLMRGRSGPMRGRSGPIPSRSSAIPCRNGRPVPRLHPLIAERLFHLTSETIAAASDRPAHAGLTRSLLERLQQRGWTLIEIIGRSGLSTTELEAVAAGRRAYCSQLTEATIKAVTQALWVMSPPAQAHGRPVHDQPLAAAA